MEFNYRVYAEPSPLVIVLSLALSLVQLVALWKIFVKAGEPGWAAIVPIYNLYITFKIAWGSGWKFLLMLIPLVNVVVGIMLLFKLARSFGKGTGFGFGLLFLAPIFFPILGFGDARYQGPDGAQPLQPAPAM
ncbi:MAG TPA: DUF5684 domain-containing protein [Clostridia bacterium]|jgi:hypothetical protein|nr:DUF5684 domain-containing protein [Clostridia bacterium]